MRFCLLHLQLGDPHSSSLATALATPYLGVAILPVGIRSSSVNDTATNE
jgi:hypothetical protein